MCMKCERAHQDVLVIFLLLLFGVCCLLLLEPIQRGSVYFLYKEDTYSLFGLDISNRCSSPATKEIVCFVWLVVYLVACLAWFGVVCFVLLLSCGCDCIWFSNCNSNSNNNNNLVVVWWFFSPAQERTTFVRHVRFFHKMRFTGFCFQLQVSRNPGHDACFHCSR